MEKMIKHKQLMFGSALFTLIMFAVLAAISMVNPSVLGVTNGTTITEAYIWNTEPNVTSVTVGPNEISLTPGNTTRINCTAYIWDYNGWDDINVTNATFYHSSVTNVDPDDNNNHYSANPDTNCTCEQLQSTNASCYCYFDIWYYANNGTWTCNITVQDDGGNATERIYRFNDSNTGTATILSLIGIDVTNYVSYGNLSVTETSDTKPVNITNYGNEPINVSVRAYGGTENRHNPTNSSLICELGNIKLDRERYSLADGSLFDDMIAVTNTSTIITDLTVPVRDSDDSYSDSTNTTYWRLNVPLTVGGYCNGSIEFFASDADN
jgi:hypothetical protein